MRDRGVGELFTVVLLLLVLFSRKRDVVAVVGDFAGEASARARRVAQSRGCVQPKRRRLIWS
jgi:hypothetical protein